MNHVLADKQEQYNQDEASESLAIHSGIIVNSKVMHKTSI